MRIVSLIASATEIVAALGLEDDEGLTIELTQPVRDVAGDLARELDDRATHPPALVDAAPRPHRRTRTEASLDVALGTRETGDDRGAGGHHGLAIGHIG